MLFKKKLTVIFLSFISLSALSQSTDAPAFPGAEGHGRYTTGGREGIAEQKTTVYHVTNLNDSGTGSLRAAVSSANRIVVFDVGGVIALKSDLTIKDNITILGQTAPYPGITLRYYTVRPNGNNIIMRFIRIRRGQEKDINDSADASWCRNLTGIILDHCSFSWSIDEVASFYDNNNFTMQWCTIGESLCNPGHSKGEHGYGGIWGGKLASFHHNMIIHVKNRSPRFNGARYNWTGYTSNKLYSTYQWDNAVQAENVDFRNCVVYNCANGCYGGPGGGQINMVNNYYKTGPASSTTRITTASVANSTTSSSNSEFWTMFSRYYISGNQLNNTTNADWNYINYDSGTYTLNGVHYTPDSGPYYDAEEEDYITVDGTSYLSMQLTEPIPTGDITTHTAATAFNKVLTYAGASLCRDEVDQRYATEAQNGTATYTGSTTNKKGWIDLVSDVNGYTEETFETSSRNADFDTDNDGIPDVWETANGLDPNDASDALAYTLDTEKGWYTNIEVYANSLVEDIMLSENDDAQTTFDDYYPTCTPISEIEQMATIVAPTSTSTASIPVTYIIAQSTNTGTNTSKIYNFNDDITVSNNNGKSYATGNEDGIKYSANVQYTINLPLGVSITQVSISGYDNSDGTAAYLAELNGTTYSTTDYLFPMWVGKEDQTSYEDFVKEYEITLETPATDSITFTPKGKQVVWVITLTGTKKTTSSTPVSYLSANKEILSTEYYNMQGMRTTRKPIGLSIEVTHYTDGSSTTRKVINH